MKHHLAFKDDKSDEFWKIEISLYSFMVTYGKIGTKGEREVKSFGSEEECHQEAERLVNEKLKHGYVAQDAESNVSNEDSNIAITKDEIIALLKSNSLEDIEEGIQRLGTFTEKSKPKTKSPLYNFFDLQKEKFGETELIEIEVCGSYLQG